MTLFAIIGGIWLSLLYSAAVLPASIRVIRVTVSRGFISAATVSLGLSMGQLPWCVLAALIFFQNTSLWVSLDLPLRGAAVLFLLWMAYRTSRASDVKFLRIQSDDSLNQPFRSSFWRSFRMPWRLPFWASIILSVGIHLRGPGWLMAMAFAGGCLIGQLLWFCNFMAIAAIFGHRVPEEISLKSMNKLRFLSTVVLAGLTLIILAPIAFPPT